MCRVPFWEDWKYSATSIIQTQTLDYLDTHFHNFFAVLQIEWYISYPTHFINLAALRCPDNKIELSSMAKMSCANLSKFFSSGKGTQKQLAPLTNCAAKYNPVSYLIPHVLLCTQHEFAQCWLHPMASLFKYFSLSLLNSSALTSSLSLSGARLLCQTLVTWSALSWVPCDALMTLHSCSLCLSERTSIRSPPSSWKALANRL